MIAGAAADVVALQRLDHVVEGQAERDQLRRVGLDVVLLDVAADRIDAGDARHALELRPDDPVLHRAQIGGALDLAVEPLALGREVGAVALPARARRRARAASVGAAILDRPHVDLAEAGRDRPHPRLGARRQARRGLEQPLADLLAREVDVGALAEDRRDLREAVARERARVFQARDAGERGLDRERDLLLDLDRRQRRRDGVDLHLVVGDVGHGVDRQPRQRTGAERGRDGAERDDEPAAADGEIDDALDHAQCSCSGFGLFQLGLEGEGVGDRDGLAGRKARTRSRRRRHPRGRCAPARASKPSASRTNSVGLPLIGLQRRCAAR